jgi:hypothetical protein
MSNGIITESLLHDESLFARNIRVFPHGPKYPGSPTPPLFYYLSYVAVSLLGNAEWVYRLIPLLSAVTGLILISFFLIKNFSKYVAFIGIFLTATSEPIIHFAGNAHPYATDFLCSISFLFLTFNLLQKSSLKLWIFWLISALIFLPLSYSAIFIVTSYGIFMILYDLWKKEKKLLKQRLIGLIPLAIFALLLVFLVFLKQEKISNKLPESICQICFPHSFLPWKFFKWFYTNTIEIFSYLFWYKQGGIIGLFLSISGLAWLINKKQYIICNLCLGPVLFTIIAAVFQKWTYCANRAMIFCFPFFLILIISGMELVWNAVKGKKSKLLIAVALFLISLPHAWTLKQAVIRIDDSYEAVRSLYQTVKPEIAEDDSFLVYYAAKTQFQYYFSEYIDRSVTQPWSHKGNYIKMQEFIEDNIPSKKGRIWLIFSHINETNVEVEFMVKITQKYCELMKSFSFSGCKAFLFQCP